MFAGKVHDLSHFRFRHLIGENPAFADPMLVHVHHDSLRRLVILVEETLEHVDHKLHGRVIVIEQQDTIKIRPLGLRLGLGNDRSPRAPLIALAFTLTAVYAVLRLTRQ